MGIGPSQGVSTHRSKVKDIWRSLNCLTSYCLWIVSIFCVPSSAKFQHLCLKWIQSLFSPNPLQKTSHTFSWCNLHLYITLFTLILGICAAVALCMNAQKGEFPNKEIKRWVCNLNREMMSGAPPAGQNSHYIVPFSLKKKSMHHSPSFVIIMCECVSVCGAEYSAMFLRGYIPIINQHETCLKVHFLLANRKHPGDWCQKRSCSFASL